MNFKELFTKINRPMTDEEKTRQRGYVDFAFRTFSRSLFALIVIVLLMTVLNAVIPSAHAGGGGLTGGATEITQMMNNTELALQTVEEKIQTIEQIEHTFLHRLQQLKSSIGQYTAPFQKAFATYERIKNVHSKLVSLQGKIENLDTTLENRFHQFAASNLTWNEWTARESSAIRAGDQRARAEIESNRRVLESVQESMEGYQKAADGLEDSPGVHQAIRQLGPMLTILGGDVNKLITITAQGNAVRAEEQLEKRAREEADLDLNKKFQEQLDAERASRHQFLDALGGKKK